MTAKILKETSIFFFYKTKYVIIKKKNPKRIKEFLVNVFFDNAIKKRSNFEIEDIIISSVRSEKFCACEFMR
jgi:hypothetical protein